MVLAALIYGMRNKCADCFAQRLVVPKVSLLRDQLAVSHFGLHSRRRFRLRCRR